MGSTHTLNSRVKVVLIRMMELTRLSRHPAHVIRSGVLQVGRTSLLRGVSPHPPRVYTAADG